MSLSDKIINGIMGTNIRTIKVSVEQLAQIVNETIIAATTNEEELRAIEKAISINKKNRNNIIINKLLKSIVLHTQHCIN